MESQWYEIVSSAFLLSEQAIAAWIFNMNEDILISSNWSQGNSSLSLEIVDNLSEIDLDEMMKPESCVLLSPGGQDDDRGQLEISGPVASVILITDNQRWEILGNIQYLFSCSGKLIEEAEGLKVYSVEMSLKTSNCGRHILRLPPSVQSCWIYSVFVEKAKTSLKAAPSAHFDLENIKNLMSDTKELSSNAETFKNLFDTFQTSSPFMVPRPLETNSSISTGNHLSEDKSQELTVMKFYIDKKLKDLEEKILRRIEESEKVQSEKLDKIISLIEARNSLT